MPTPVHALTDTHATPSIAAAAPVGIGAVSSDHDDPSHRSTSGTSPTESTTVPTVVHALADEHEIPYSSASDVPAGEGTETTDHDDPSHCCTNGDSIPPT